MDYSGENGIFRFSEGCCEVLPHNELTSNAAAQLGAKLAGSFRRISAGCDSFSHMHLLYAICSGISSAGKDVYVYENTDLPSFRFSYPLLSSDCGVFISGNGSVKLKLYGAERLALSGEETARILTGKPAETSEKCGRIISVSSFRDIYICNLTDALGNSSLPIPAAVSCGSRSVRTLWEAFFTGSDDELVFQVSADGQKVNAYSSELGFISNEKLQLACAAADSSKETVVLPDSFHIDAELTGLPVKRVPDFGKTLKKPPRFLVDPLYMCIKLASNRKIMLDTIKNLPELASVRREITADFSGLLPFYRIIAGNGHRIILSRSGRNRLALAVQAHSAETALEICGEWCDKLRRESAGCHIDKMKF